MLEERLDPDRFVGLHRSAIVRLDLTEALIRPTGGDCEVRLKSGMELKVSRIRFDEPERRIGLVK